MCVFSPMAAGLLSGKYLKDREPIEGARFSLAHLGYRYNQPYWNEANLSAVETLKQIALDHGRDLPVFSLAWALSSPAITAVVCGATSVAQLEQNLKAVEETISDEARDACDAVWHQLRPRQLFYGR